MAEIIVSIVVDKLASLIQNDIGLLWGVTKEMEKLLMTLSRIQAVLEDAEHKQTLQEHRAIKDWLRQLKYASYEVDDILDDFATEANSLESGSRKKVSLSSLTSYPIVGNIAFRYKIGKRMREVRERLEQIANRLYNYHLHAMNVEKRVGFSTCGETSSHLTKPEVYGREEEREKIVKVLINDVADCEDVMVYPIIGMGGLGKTTLAQLVYNDDRVVSHFEKRIWVCVSESFDVKKLLKEIIESASKSACEDLSLGTLLRRLWEMLNGKRYLLVLDNVWNEDQEKWNKLKGVLKECGSRGASIIITTRSESVASIMGTLPSHRLKVLCPEDCLLLFNQHAFGIFGERHPNLVAIGKDIVKKCNGLPLAVKTLGSLMSFKSEEREWVVVRDSEIWDLQDHETAIIPALRLSYYNLPLELRRCFAYCAVYEKDTEIERDDLIHLWMANGLISSANEKMDMEDIGNEIWKELYRRSFFQKVVDELVNNKVTFTMHDLVHDLAQCVMEEECQIVEDIERPTDDMVGKRVCHLNLIACSKPLTTIPKELHIRDSLRTLIYTQKQDVPQTNSSELSIFENYGALRAFAAVTNAPNLAFSIGGLKHLRYLRLGGRGITTLPDSICNLWNLQTLDLYGCYNLQRLPKKMRCLRNLRHLLTPPWLIEMPPFIGELTFLKTLSTFIVEERRGCGLDELQLLNLGGSLIINNLERVGNLVDAKTANLIAKQNLYSLDLSWGKNNSNIEVDDSQKNVEQLLEALKPHPNLQELRIYSFKGTHFPLWMNDYSNLQRIVTLSLIDCINCRQLPPLQQLPCLRHLVISNMNNLEYMINDDNNYEGQGSGNAVRGFPSLEKLSLEILLNLKGLSKEEEGSGPLFPCLRVLRIYKCTKVMNLPPCFPALEELDIRDHPELTSMSDWLENLTSLRKLRIVNCPKLTLITANHFRNLTELQDLTIMGCPKLAQRYNVGIGEDWQMIAHIPRVIVWG